VLKILVDEDMPRPTAGLLHALGIDAIDLRDIGLRGSTDAEVLSMPKNIE
jgi:predicted nuclease of predicted toxin-antitoxin system